MTIHFFIAALLCLGLAGIALLPNLIRKLLAMNVMQVAVIMFFLSVAFKDGGAAPILTDPGMQDALAESFMNPLPHTLMLTAIVVSVSTTGLALGLLVRIRRRFGTLDESRLLGRLR